MQMNNTDTGGDYFFFPTKRGQLFEVIIPVTVQARNADPFCFDN